MRKIASIVISLFIFILVFAIQVYSAFAQSGDLFGYMESAVMQLYRQ